MKYSSCSLFKGINEVNLKHLVNCLQIKEIKYLSGENVRFNYSGTKIVGIILSGKVFIKKLDRNGNYTILETLSKNGVFSNVFTYTLTDANCIEIFASENTSILYIDYNNIFKRCSRACSFHSVFVQNFLNVIIEKSKILSQRVEILSNKTIKDKILSYISLVFENEKEDTFTLPMSYTSFAEYLCVDRSAMMRELKKLSDKGILKIVKKEITILQKEYI